MFAAALVALVAVGVGVTRRQVEPIGTSAMITGGGSQEPALTRRQVQFLAPRGTRIIWILDADFELR